MATLTIEGREVDVDDGFLKLSPDEQNRTVDEIASSMKLTPQAASAPEGSGMFMNATAGLNSAIYNTVGAPVDAARWALNKGAQGINALAGSDVVGQIPADSFGGSQSLANAFSAAGVAKPEDVVAGSTEERIARGLGEGVGYTVGPQAAVGGFARAGVGTLAPRTMDALGALTGQTASVGRTVGNALAGGTAGAGAVAGMEAADEPWKSLAGLGGGLAGGGVGALVAGVPSLARSGAGLAGEFLDPLTAAGRQRAAGRQLQEAASDPSAARQALETMPDELVPGSVPTTFQASGDMGLGALERRVMTENPDAFMTRRADQNAARLGALDAVQPGGHPEAVSRAFRERLAAIDTETESALTAATEAARGRSQGLGGNLPPETYGDALRGSLRQAEIRARDQERTLWQAVDPENRLDVLTGNAGKVARDTIETFSPVARPMEGEESAVFNLAAKMPEQVRFRMASELRSRISTAMRNELLANGQSPAYARLSRLRGAVQDDLSGVIAQRADEDARAVAAGTMSEDQTLASNLTRQIQEWEARRVGEEAARAGSVGVGRSSVVGGSGRALPVARAQGQGFGGSGNAAGREGFSRAAGAGTDTPGLPFDDAAQGRLATATQATKDRAQTFGRGTNAQILRRSGQDGPYELASASVPGRLFFPGSASGQRIAEFRQAAGDAQALDVLQDYAAAQLRKSAERADGTLDPARLAGWRRNHADALRAFPDLDARFADAGRASQAMAEAATTRRARMDDYQRGAVGRLMNLQDPSDVTRTVGGIFSRQDAATMMESLAANVRGDAAAREGLRKSVADYIAGRFVGNTEAATTGQGTIRSEGFQDFVRQNRPALRHVLSDAEIETLDRIAVDLQRSNRSLYAVKIPGQSNTAQDLTRVRKDDGFASVLSRTLAASAAGATSAGAAGFSLAGPVGAGVGAIGGAIGAALRQHGVQKVDDLVRDAMLDPHLAKVLLQRTSPANDQGVARLLASRYRAAATAGALSMEEAEPPAHPDVTIRAGVR